MHVNGQPHAYRPDPSPTRSRPMSRVRKILGWVLLAYVVYAIIKSPTQAADVVKTSFEILAEGVRSIFAFFDSLIAR